MKFFKDQQGAKVFAYEADGSQDAIIPDSYIRITEAEAESIRNPPPTPSQIIATLTAAVQYHLDATARTRNYDGILSLCSYAASTNTTFGPEGLAGVAWRDAVWERCYTILAEVQASTRSIPTQAELLAELPEMVWPV